MLRYSGGDIKAVQGDTGHSQADMVTQVYGHTFDENRKRIAGLMEKSFFESSQKAPPTDEKSEKVLQILKTSPQLAELILSLAGEAK